MRAGFLLEFVGGKHSTPSTTRREREFRVFGKIKGVG